MIWRFSDSVESWEIVHFILNRLPILVDSSTSWPHGQVCYVMHIFVRCVCSLVAVLLYDYYMVARFDQ